MFNGRRSCGIRSLRWHQVRTLLRVGDRRRIKLARLPRRPVPLRVRIARAWLRLPKWRVRAVALVTAFAVFAGIGTWSALGQGSKKPGQLPVSAGRPQAAPVQQPMTLAQRRAQVRGKAQAVMVPAAAKPAVKVAAGSNIKKGPKTIHVDGPAGVSTAHVLPADTTASATSTTAATLTPDCSGIYMYCPDPSYPMVPELVVSDARAIGPDGSVRSYFDTYSGLLDANGDYSMGYAAGAQPVHPYRGISLPNEPLTVSLTMLQSTGILKGTLPSSYYDDTVLHVHIWLVVGCANDGTYLYDTGQDVDLHSSLYAGYYEWTGRSYQGRRQPPLNIGTTITAQIPLPGVPSTCTDYIVSPVANFAQAGYVYNPSGPNTLGGQFAGPAVVYGDVAVPYSMSPIAASQTLESYGCGTQDSSGFTLPEAGRNGSVNTATGAFTQCLTDAHLGGAGVPLQAVRSYSSSNTATGLWGSGWSSPWSRSLSIDPPTGNVLFNAEGGSQYPFTKQADGSFVPQPWVHAKLTADGAGGYLLTTLDHRVIAFNSAGQLLSERDRARTGLTYTYSGTQLVSVTNAAGRSLSLSYTGSLLSRIMLSDGRHIDYNYTGGLLTSVTGLDGQTTRYSYTGNWLSSITDPLGNHTVMATYNSTGTVLATVDAAGSLTQYTHTMTPGGDGETDITAPNGGIWTDIYAGGALVSQFDPFGNQTSLGYDNGWNGIRVTDPLGNSTDKTLDASGRLTRLHPPAGGSQTWTYDANGNVATSVDGNGDTTTFTYNTLNELTVAKDALGNTSSYAYNPDGQLASTTTARGEITRYGYNSVGDQTSVTSPLGETTTRGFDTAGRLVSVTDARGNAAGATPSGYTTTFTYDAADRNTSATDPAGHPTTLGYDADGNLTSVTDALGKTTSYGYDPDNRLTSILDARGNTATRSYDPDGNLVWSADPTGAKTVHSYDKADRRTAMVTPRGNVSGASSAAYTWFYSYDKDNRLASVTDPAGAITARGYDGDGRLSTITDTLGNIRSATYDNAGNTTGVTDALGNASSYTYDADNRLISAQDRDGDTTAYGYDADGNLTGITSPLGEKTSFGYDGDERRTSAVDPRGNVSGASPAAYTTTVGYDPAGNRVSVTDPLGHTATAGYDADDNVVSTTDPLNRATTFGYDADNRLTSVTAPDNAVTGYTRDADGNITSRTDANNHAIGYTWDTAGRLTQVSDPLGRSTSYGYDPDGNPATVTEPSGATITRSFDGRDLLAGVSYSDGTPAIGYTRDLAGRTTAITDGTGSRTLSYDKQNRLATVAGYTGATQFAYSYDAAGNLLSRTYPDGEQITDGYDADGRLTSQTANGATTGYTYDAAGNLTATVLPAGNGYTETRSYDTAGHLTGISDANGSTTLASWLLYLDATGQPASIAVTRAGAGTNSQTYSYDAAGRIAGSCSNADTTGACLAGAATTAYTYDKVGNRLSATVNGATTTYSYDAADQLTAATGANPATYTYDANGNQTGDANGTYTYNAAGKLATANIGGAGYAFTYDADGNRAAVAKNGATDRTMLWDPNGPLPQLATEATGTGAKIADYTYDPAGEIQTQQSASGTFYYHHDWLGSVTDLTNASGVRQTSYAYDPFGTQTTTTTAAGAPANPFGYTGGYTDPYQAGRLDLRARIYDPAAGRFTTGDPMPAAAADPAISRYAYANNQPTALTDPSGQCPICIAVAIGAFLGAAFGGGTYAWHHRDDPNASIGGFFKATATGGLIGAGGGLLIPAAGALAVDALGLEGLAATATSAAVNAGTGAAYDWAVNTAQGRPTTPTDLAIGALGGASGDIVGPAWRALKRGISRIDWADDSGSIGWGGKGSASSADGFSEPAPGSEDQNMVTVYRFADRNDRNSLLPRAALDSRGKAWLDNAQKDPDWVKMIADMHMSGWKLQFSPVVSVLLDHSAGAATTDGWLHDIVHELAPDLGTFRVPADRLIAPDSENKLSIAETEYVFNGIDLGDFLVKWESNPYLEQD